MVRLISARKADGYWKHPRAIAGLERTEILERVWSAKEEKRRAGSTLKARSFFRWCRI